MGANETVVLRDEQQEPTFAYLVVKNGFRSGHIFQLKVDSTTVGRDAENDIVLDDQAISRRHLKIRSESASDSDAEVFVLYDLATANGTQINGEEVLKQPLVDGDEIAIGETELVFKQV